ncbi:MAG: hypothetical protein LBS72_06410 [Oscillospiraceae bacterium]|jgi:hypothetical protein|nr:hypothetical protein [Oscillospiraceae bacterium]
MQRRERPNSKSSYHVRGAAPPRVRVNPRRRAQLALRRIIALAVALAILVLIIYVFTLIPRGGDDALRLGFHPGDPIQPFGKSLLFLSDGVLNCVGANGGVRWQFPLGISSGFNASQSGIVAWSGEQLYILNASGEAVYNDRMADTVQFARIGAAYIATLIGESSGQIVRVTDHAGNLIEEIDDFSSITVIDCGFFDTQELRLWTLGIDLMGSTVTTVLNTYDPRSHSATGNAALSDQLIYKVYTQNKWLMLVSNVSVAAYDYNCIPVSSQAPSIIYGWQFARTRVIQNETLTLLTKPPAADGSRSMRSLRLIGRGADQILRLPAPCFDALLGGKAVYGFSANMVYSMRYGQTSFASHELPIAIDQVLDILDDDVAVLAYGADVFLYKLPD